MPAEPLDPKRSTLLSVMFADIAGSTRLYETLGDASASRIVETCIEHMDGATRLNGGTTVQVVGDETLSTFPDPELGLQAAVEMMRRVTSEAAAGQPLALRIGLHHGPLLMREKLGVGGPSRVFGSTVNTAARIVALAKARQILISAETLTLLPSHWRDSARHLDAFSLKGKREETAICEILWERREHTTLLRALPTPRPARLQLHYRQRCHVVDERTKYLTLGREPGNDIVIEDRRVSRRHARIEHRRGKFVLVDTSTNGSFVTVEGYGEIALRLEEFVLHGRGHIRLGRVDDGSADATLSFEVL